MASGSYSGSGRSRPCGSRPALARRRLTRPSRSRRRRGRTDARSGAGRRRSRCSRGRDRCRGRSWSGILRAGPDAFTAYREHAVRLSILFLDQSPISAGSTGPDALANTLDLARLADDLGYHRYWVAEHHGGPMLAGPAPEVLIGPIAAATTRIRVGSGGVMLPHYSPFKVAEAFSLLAGAVRRADRSRPRPRVGHRPARRRSRCSATGARRRPTTSRSSSPSCSATSDDAARRPPVRAPGRALPGRPDAPEPWLLGSSPQSAVWAAQLGLPYAFADFINRDAAGVAPLPRVFDPGPRLAAPVSRSPRGRRAPTPTRRRSGSPRPLA